MIRYKWASGNPGPANKLAPYQISLSGCVSVGEFKRKSNCDSLYLIALVIAYIFCNLMTANVAPNQLDVVIALLFLGGCKNQVLRPEALRQIVARPTNSSSVAKLATGNLVVSVQ